MHPVDALIAGLVEECRRATDAEVRRIVEHVGQAPFASRPVRVDRRLWGLTYGGQRLGRESRLPSLEAHLLKRVYVERQWPEGTTAEQYVADLHRAVRHPQAELWTYRYRGRPFAAFFAPSHVQADPCPEKLIFVAYDAGYGTITTGFQANSPWTVFVGEFNGLRRLR